MCFRYGWQCVEKCCAGGDADSNWRAQGGCHSEGYKSGTAFVRHCVARERIADSKIMNKHSIARSGTDHDVPYAVCCHVCRQDVYVTFVTNIVTRFRRDQASCVTFFVSHSIRSLRDCLEATRRQRSSVLRRLLSPCNVTRHRARIRHSGAMVR